MCNDIGSCGEFVLRELIDCLKLNYLEKYNISYIGYKLLLVIQNIYAKFAINQEGNIIQEYNWNRIQENQESFKESRK